MLIHGFLKADLLRNTMHPSSPQQMYTQSKASSAMLQPGSTSWLIFKNRGCLESSSTNILWLRLNMQRSVNGA